MSKSFHSHLIVYGFSASVSAGFYAGQMQYLRREGYEVAVISTPGAEVERLAESEGAALYPVEIEREISPLRDACSLWRLYRLLRKLRPALTNFGTPKAGLLGGLAAIAARVPCRVYTLHGLRLETASGMRRLVLWCAEWLACRTAHITFCVSESLRSRAVELGVVRPEVAKVLGSGTCNGVDTSRFGNVDIATLDALRARFELRSDTPVIGFVGRLVRDKGISELVEAFRQLSVKRPSLRMLLIGEFEDGDPVPTEIKTYILNEPRILRTGHVKDVSVYYPLMQVMAFPTYREGFGAASLEAQASGVPVVASNVTGVVDSLVDGVTGTLVPARDANALAAQINRLLDDPELRARMGRAGRERALKEFAPERLWKSVAACYRDLLGRGTQGIDQLDLSPLAEPKNL